MSENESQQQGITNEDKESEDKIVGEEGQEQANTQETTRVGNVGRLGDLLILHEPLGVRILYEDVEHHQVVLGVVEDGLHHWAVVVAAVQVFWEPPLVIGTKPGDILIKLTTNRAGLLGRQIVPGRAGQGVKTKRTILSVKTEHSTNKQKSAIQT